MHHTFPEHTVNFSLDNLASLCAVNLSSFPSGEITSFPYI